MAHITPEDARKLAGAKLNGPVIAPLLEHVKKRICDAAEAGKFEIAHPLHGWPVFKWPSPQEQEALWTALIREGWKVVHHPDPDPGHPGSAPYTTISW